MSEVKLMKIFCDSSCDLLKTEIEQLGVIPITFPYTLNGNDQTKLFNSEQDYIDFYAQIRQGKIPATACINNYTFEEIFTPYLKNGEDILYIHLSSGLTSTFNYKNQLLTDLQDKYPNQKIYFIDSLHVTMAIGLLIKKAVELMNSGKSIDQIRDYIENLKNKIACYFAPEDLLYLRRGGRISTAQAVGGTILNVKPICKADNNGKIVKIGIVPGAKAVIKKLCNIVQENMIENELPIVVMHADKKPVAEIIKNELLKIYPNKEILIRPVGPTIGTHCGPGTLAVVFYSNSR